LDHIWDGLEACARVSQKPLRTQRQKGCENQETLYHALQFVNDQQRIINQVDEKEHLEGLKKEKTAYNDLSSFWALLLRWQTLV